MADSGDHGDRPVVELFVKAAVDKMKNGGCPMCHRYFLIFYIMREQGLLDLVVTTFLPENPPKEVLDFSNGKRFPAIKIHKGLDSNGADISGVTGDTMDEIETILEKFDCHDMRSRKQSREEAVAETSYEDLYIKFNLFLKSANDDPTQLIRILDKVDSHLKETGHRFMIGDSLTRADCYLLPWLQHVRVAGKAYKNFEIPVEMDGIWRYLKHAYSMDAFLESCPADREIITHYDGKASCKAQIATKKSQLMGEDRTLSIPDCFDD